MGDSSQLSKLSAVDLEIAFDAQARRLLKGEAGREMCLRGSLEHIMRPHGQRYIHRAVAKWKKENPKSLVPIVLNCHRRLGKSFWGAAVGVERAIQRPGRKVRYGMATDEQVNEVVGDSMEKILEQLPADLKPSRKANKWTFRNPRTFAPGERSEFSIHAVEHLRGNRLRGLGATDWILDEVRDLKDPEYLVRNVVGFHFVDALYDGFDPLLVMLSTPPESPAHPFSYIFIPEAEKAGTYFKITVEDNDDWSKADEEFIMQLCGGRDTTAWRREAMCELIGDDARLVCPEFEERLGSILESRPRPPYFHSFVCADTGWRDHFGVVFGYLDFENGLLHYEDEIFERYRSMGEMAELIGEKWEKLYDGQSVGTRWYADATGLVMGSFGRDHGIHFQPVEKHDKWASIARFRTALQAGRITIDPRCTNLILQGRYGIKNRQGTDFERTNAMGHLDVLAAAIYLFRRVNFQENPFPKPSVVPGQNILIDPNEYAKRIQSRQGFERLTYLPTRRKRR